MADFEFTGVVQLLSLFLLAVILFSSFYFFKKRSKSEEWQRRVLLVVIFYAIHELSFYLHESIIYQFTNIVFMVFLLYALIHVMAFERTIEEVKDERREILKRLEEMKKVYEKGEASWPARERRK